MSKFVHRATDGTIGLVVPSEYPGFADEELADDDPELVEFFTALNADLSNPQPKTATIYASAKFIITDDGISGVNVSSRFSGAFKADVGSYWIFFTESQPDANYIVQAFNGGLIRCYVKPEDYGTDYVIITTTDMLGDPTDPTSLSLIITRVN